MDFFVMFDNSPKQVHIELGQRLSIQETGKMLVL